MAAIYEKNIARERKRMRKWSVEQLRATFDEKYRGPDSIDEPLEAVLRLLNYHHEMYLTDDQYAELEARKTARVWLTPGESGALTTLRLLQAVHMQGAQKYFHRGRRLVMFLSRGVGYTLLLFVTLSVIGSIGLIFVTKSLALMIFPLPLFADMFDGSAKGAEQVIGLGIGVALMFGSPWVLAYMLMPNAARLKASYLKHQSRLS